LEELRSRRVSAWEAIVSLPAPRGLKPLFGEPLSNTCVRPTDAWTLGQEVVRHTGITYGDLRRARAALEAAEPQPLTAAPTTTS
jgi:hypothetical protein